MAASYWFLISVPGARGTATRREDPWLPIINSRGGVRITTTETLICPDWETLVVPVSQLGTPGRDKRGGPFVPDLATGTKGYLLSRLVTPTGTKGPFFSCFPFLNSFSILIILLHFN